MLSLICHHALTNTRLNIYSLCVDCADIQYLIGNDAETVQQSSTLFLLKLKDQHKVSQVAIDDIIVDCSKRLFLLTIQPVLLN